MIDKRVYIDVETTGVDCTKHGIIQLSGIVEIDGKEKERFDYRVRPFSDDVVDPEALKVSGNTVEGVMTFASTAEIHSKFTKMLCAYIDKYSRFDKFHFIAYNAGFDSDFVRKFLEKNGDKFYGSLFYYPAIDVMNTAAEYFLQVRSKLENFKLVTVAKALDMDVDESRLHDSMYDIEITMQMHKKLRGIVRYDSGK